MKKKICFLAVFICLTFFAFAQPKAVLSASDIDAFIKNYTEIGSTLEAYEDALSSINVDVSNLEGKAITDAINKARGFAVPAELRTKLASFGLGNNAFEKCVVIIYGMASIFMEEFVAAFEEEMGINEQSAEVRKQTIDPIKAAIHANDLKLISSRKTELMAIAES